MFQGYIWLIGVPLFGSGCVRSRICSVKNMVATSSSTSSSTSQDCGCKSFPAQLDPDSQRAALVFHSGPIAVKTRKHPSFGDKVLAAGSRLACRKFASELSAFQPEQLLHLGLLHFCFHSLSCIEILWCPLDEEERSPSLQHCPCSMSVSPVLP